MNQPAVLGPFGMALLGMGTVFLVLLLIAWVLSLLKVFSKKEAPAAAPAAPAAPAPASAGEDEDEVVAVIMAAVSSCMGGQAFRIRSISAGSFVARPFVRGAQAGGWVNAARIENTTNK